MCIRDSAKTKPARDGLKAQKSEKARAAYRQAHESDFIIAEASARYFKAHGDVYKRQPPTPGPPSPPTPGT